MSENVCNNAPKADVSMEVKRLNNLIMLKKHKKRSVLLMLMLILSMLVNCACSQTKYIDSKVYAEANNKVLDFKNEKLFKDLKDKRIIFTGETHGVAANQTLDLAFVKYFKKESDMKYLLLESAYSDAYFLNKYLKTGDEAVLKELFRPLKGTFAYTQNSFEFWKGLYAYNQTLPAADQIVVVGVDIVHQNITAYRYLAEVLPKTPAPTEIAGQIEAFRTALKQLEANQSGTNMIEKSKILQADLLKYEKAYQDFLGSDYFGFKLVNENILNGEIAYNVPEYEWDKTRDEMIFNNFVQVDKYLSKGVYYGQWGLDHIFQSKTGNTDWFAAQINQMPEYKGKILSIAFQYNNCEQITKNHDMTYGKESIHVMLPAFQMLKLDNEPYTICDLTKTGSPYKTTDYGDELVRSHAKMPLTNYIQYVVTINKSPAAEAFVE